MVVTFDSLISLESWHIPIIQVVLVVYPILRGVQLYYIRSWSLWLVFVVHDLSPFHMAAQRNVDTVIFEPLESKSAHISTHKLQHFDRDKSISLTSFTRSKFLHVCSVPGWTWMFDSSIQSYVKAVVSAWHMIYRRSISMQ